MTSEHISTAYFINPSHESVRLYVYPLSLLGNGSGETLPRKRVHTNKRIVGCVVVYEVCVASKESRLLGLPRTSCYTLIPRFTEGVRFLILQSIVEKCLPPDLTFKTLHFTNWCIYGSRMILRLNLYQFLGRINQAFFFCNGDVVRFLLCGN
jgi:hypothetical protein